MTDAARERFERWMSEDWKWPDAVARRYGHYVLAHTESAWKAWQAALSEQPAWRCYCDEQGLGEPGVTCGDCPRDYGHRVAAHPAPVERVALSDEQIFRLAEDLGWQLQADESIGKDALEICRAVIAEYERANGIRKGEQE